jgi:hypothetical protein
MVSKSSEAPELREPPFDALRSCGPISVADRNNSFGLKIEPEPGDYGVPDWPDQHEFAEVVAGFFTPTGFLGT